MIGRIVWGISLVLWLEWITFYWIFVGELYKRYPGYSANNFNPHYHYGFRTGQTNR